MLSGSSVRRSDDNELEAHATVGGEEHVIAKTPSRRMAEATTDAWAFMQFGSTAVVRDRRHITALGHLQFHRLRLNVPRLTEQHRTSETVSRGKGGRAARARDDQPPNEAMLHRSMYLTGTSRFDNEDVEFLGDPTDRSKGFIGDGRPFLPPVSFRLTKRRRQPQPSDPLSMVLNAGKVWLQQYGDNANRGDSSGSTSSSPAPSSSSSSSDDDDDDNNRKVPPSRERRRPPSPVLSEEGDEAALPPSSAPAAEGGGVRGSAWVGRKDAQEIIEKQRQWYAEALRDSGDDDDGDSDRPPKAMEDDDR